jgi:hypothetical protein
MKEEIITQKNPIEPGLPRVRAVFAGLLHWPKGDLVEEFDVDCIHSGSDSRGLRSKYRTGARWTPR